MELHNQLEVAKKVKRVIESCENLDQLNSAREYMNLFFKQFSSPLTPKTFTNIVEADQSTVKLYNNLFSVWENKVGQICDPETLRG